MGGGHFMNAGRGGGGGGIDNLCRDCAQAREAMAAR